jgi:predicted GTPase
MGYGDKQVSDLEATVNAVDCDLVLVATPIDLTRIINIERPAMRIGYSLEPEDGSLARAVREAVLPGYRDACMSAK